MQAPIACKRPTTDMKQSKTSLRSFGFLNELGFLLKLLKEAEVVGVAALALLPIFQAPLLLLMQPPPVLGFLFVCLRIFQCSAGSRLFGCFLPLRRPAPRLLMFVLAQSFASNAGYLQGVKKV